MLRPDIAAPARNPEFPNRRYLMELKPDTPTGRRAGAISKGKYESASENKTRVIYYKPEDFQ
jgi:hypothetical protein